MIKNSEVVMELIGNRRVYSIDVGDMTLNEGREFMDNLCDKIRGREIGSTYKQYKKDKLYLNIAMGFAITSFLILYLTKFYYGVS